MKNNARNFVRSKTCEFEGYRAPPKFEYDIHNTVKQMAHHDPQGFVHKHEIRKDTGLVA